MISRFPIRLARLPLAAVLAVAAFLALAPDFGRAQGRAPFREPTGYVNDFAGVLDAGEKAKLEALLTRIDEVLEVQFAIVTRNDLGDEDPTDYANRLYEAWKIGNKKTDRGVLLLDAIGEGPGQNFFRVEVGYGLEGVLPDGRVGEILDRDVIPYLRQQRRDLAYASAVRSLTRPILVEMGRSPDAIDSLMAEGGYSLRRGSRGTSPIGLPFLVLLLIIILSRFGGGRRGRRGGMWIGGSPWGGFGGFGGFGGGGGSFGGGGFGGFGGGSSGGGGAGRGY